jgi:phage gpG-like protein
MGEPVKRRGALTNLANAMSQPDAARKAIGLYLVGRAQDAFRKQAKGGAAWAPRAVPNRAGVLRDLQAGRTPSSRRFDARPAAIDTGRLRSSIAYRLKGESSVVVGSNVEYASDVQRGSATTIDIDANLRKSLNSWLKGLGKTSKGKAARAAFGPLFTAGKLTVTVPPRPFIGIDAEDRRKINELATKAMLGKR